MKARLNGNCVRGFAGLHEDDKFVIDIDFLREAPVVADVQERRRIGFHGHFGADRIAGSR